MPSLPGLKSEPKVASANRNCFRRGTFFFRVCVIGPPNFSIAATVRAVNPVVEAPKQSIDAQLLVALGETREQHASFVRATVAVGVLEKQNVRRGGDEDAAIPRHHAAGKRAFVIEDSRALVASVP